MSSVSASQGSLLVKNYWLESIQKTAPCLSPRLTSLPHSPRLRRLVIAFCVRMVRLFGWRKTQRGFFDEQGKLLRVIGMVANIVTERKRAEEALRESEARYEQLAEQSRTTHWEVDPQGLFTYVSHVSHASWGYHPDEVVGQMHFYDIHPKEGREAFKAAVFAVVERKQLFQEVVHAVETKDGRISWGSTNGVPLLNGDGTLRGYRGSCTDVTERKRAEETLHESEEEKFRGVFRDAGVGMVIVSPEGRFLAANKAFCDSLGYTEEELIEKTVESVTLSEDWPAFSKKLREALTEGRGFQWFEKRCLHKSGRIVYTESSASLIRNRNGEPQYFVGEVLDITKRKEADVWSRL